MKKVLVTCLILVALGMSCGGGGDSKNLEGKIKWTETEPLTCSYDPPPTGYVSVSGDYKVTFTGHAQNISKDKLELVSVIVRLYNSADEVVGERISNPNPLGSYETRPNQIFCSLGGYEYYAQEVVRYDVFVTDSQGNEYACLRD